MPAAAPSLSERFTVENAFARSNSAFRGSSRIAGFFVLLNANYGAAASIIPGLV